tara:strand:+ start:19487 stop:19996 length:510 start_codon:yes stop_codon:yes gene_type:complete
VNLIKIDLKSIKKNPDAGQTMFQVAGRVHTEISFRGVTPQKLDKLDKIKVVSYSGNSRTGEVEVKAIGYGEYDDIMDELHKIKAKNIEIVQTRDVETVHSITPAPKYHFKYLNTKVECFECGVKIRREKIIEEDDCCRSYTICPNCREHDSFHFEFERISDALKRKGDV